MLQMNQFNTLWNSSRRILRVNRNFMLYATFFMHFNPSQNVIVETVKLEATLNLFKSWILLLKCCEFCQTAAKILECFKSDKKVWILVPFKSLCLHNRTECNLDMKPSDDLQEQSRQDFGIILWLIEICIKIYVTLWFFTSCSLENLRQHKNKSLLHHQPPTNKFIE